MSGIQRVLWGAVSIAAMWSTAAGDTLYLRDGEQHPGRLERMTGRHVWFEERDGVRVYPKSELLRVQLQRARRFDDVTSADAITDSDLRDALARLPREEDFPAAGHITLLYRRIFDLSEPGLVRDTTRRIALIVRQRGEDIASANVWYFEDTDEPEIDFALTVTPDGRVLHLDDAALKNESVYAALPEYRRLARYRFACKEPSPGSVIDMQYTVERRRQGPLNPFYIEEVFREEQPVVRKEIILIVPSDRIDDVATALAGPPGVASSRLETGGAVHLRWALTEPQRGIPVESFMPPVPAFAPTLVLGDAADWEGVAATYAEALDRHAPLSADLAEEARRLAQAGGVRAIHGFVARGIRTIPVSQRNHRLTPHAPAETAARRAANELDKNVLYWRMLEAAGIPCSFALVRGRNLGPLADDVPSLRAFERSAVYLRDAGLFSSAESDLLPFDALPPGMHGAPALLIGADGGALRRTPAPPPEAERMATEFTATLDENGALALEITYRGAGNSGAWLRSLKDLDRQQLRNRVELIAADLHPGVILRDFSVSDLPDLAQEPWLRLECAIPEFAVRAGEDLMMFTLPALQYSAHEVGRPDREFDIFLLRPLCEQTAGTVRIPPGFTVHSLPEPVTVEAGPVYYRAQPAVRADTIHFEGVFTLAALEAPREDYPALKAGIEARARLPRRRIILVRSE